MAPVTLAALTARAKSHADMEDSDFLTDDDWRGLLNTSAGHLYDKLISLWEDYFVTDATVTLTGTSHDLPADFYKLLSIDVPGADGRWCALKPFNAAERNAYRNATTTAPEAVRYRLQGLRKLTLYPGFPSGITAALRYIPTAPALNVADDSVDFLGWEEWLCLDAAIRAKAKAERAAPGLEMLLAREEARLQAAAPQRDAGVPFVPTDTYHGGA